MSKIIEAQDILADAKSCAHCIFLAAHDIGEEDESDPIQTVANIVRWKINEAIALLDEYRAEMRLVAAGAPDASPIPDLPSVKPVSRAPRTKRRGK